MTQNAELLGKLLRLFNRGGTMRAAINSIASESGWPLAASPTFLAQARLIAGQMQDVARALFAVTGPE